MTIEFKPFPKLPRLSREIVITEKIDGTNAAVIIERKELLGEKPEKAALVLAEKDGLVMLAQSRTRFITPDSDNFGFASWVQTNADSLFGLGQGAHFGEWWALEFKEATA